MTPIVKLIVLSFVLLFLSLLVYLLVVRFFYWGNKKDGPTKKR